MMFMHLMSPVEREKGEREGKAKMTEGGGGRKGNVVGGKNEEMRADQAAKTKKHGKIIREEKNIGKERRKATKRKEVESEGKEIGIGTQDENDAEDKNEDKIVGDDDDEVADLGWPEQGGDGQDEEIEDGEEEEEEEEEEDEEEEEIEEEEEEEEEEEKGEMDDNDEEDDGARSQPESGIHDLQLDDYEET